MNNEIREKDHEWVKMFHSSIDRLLMSIEKMFESRQPGAFNDELKQHCRTQQTAFTSTTCVWTVR